ncbi:MAG: hypothetical protein ACTSPL_00700 [Candidatus Odinarchaeia archaeon]
MSKPLIGMRVYDKENKLVGNVREPAPAIQVYVFGFGRAPLNKNFIDKVENGKVYLNVSKSELIDAYLSSKKK